MPLTHAVNWIDRRLRQGRAVAAPDDEADLALAGETALPTTGRKDPR